MIKIEKPSDCCGCTSCANTCIHGAISMVQDEKGFFYPSIDATKCIDCGLCDKACPIFQRRITQRQECEPEGYAVRLLDKDTLLHSSSGGAFTALADYVFDNKGVVYGAIYNEDLIVVHDRITKKEELHKLRGSKYSQSDISNVFSKVKEDLRNGILVLFSGTPCQVDGLKRYLRKTYDNLITTDIVCHSVPSPKIFHEYLNMLQEHYNDKIVAINMKDKTFGWGKECIRYDFKSGISEVNPPMIKPWVSMFESGLFTRECCFDCQYTNLDRPSDFTIGDFWDFEEKRPDIYSLHGTSIVLLNTIRSKEIFDSISSKLEKWAVSKDEYIQPRLQSPSKQNPEHNEFWACYENKGFLKAYNRYFVQSYLSKAKGKLVIIFKKLINL